MHNAMGTGPLQHRLTALHLTTPSAQVCQTTKCVGPMPHAHDEFDMQVGIDLEIVYPPTYPAAPVSLRVRDPTNKLPTDLLRKLATNLNEIAAERAQQEEVGGLQQ